MLFRNPGVTHRKWPKFQPWVIVGRLPRPQSRRDRRGTRYVVPFDSRFHEEQVHERLVDEGLVDEG